MNTWKLSDAKTDLGKVINLVLEKEPQIITRRGKKVAVIVAYTEYTRAKKRQSKLSEFFRSSPLTKVDLDLDRNKNLPRETGKRLGYENERNSFE